MTIKNNFLRYIQNKNCPSAEVVQEELKTIVQYDTCRLSDNPR